MTEVLEFSLAPSEPEVADTIAPQTSVPVYQHYLEFEPQYELVGYPQSHDGLPLLVILRHRKTGKQHVTTVADLQDGVATNGAKRWVV